MLQAKPAISARATAGTEFTKPGDYLLPSPVFPLSISDDCGDTEITHFRRKEEEEPKRIDFMTAQKRPKSVV